jgi:hypothetical protein
MLGATHESLHGKAVDAGMVGEATPNAVIVEQLAAINLTGKGYRSNNSLSASSCRESVTAYLKAGVISLFGVAFLFNSAG